MATIKNIHDYSDIINLPYKKSKKYKHMSQKDRASTVCILLLLLQDINNLFKKHKGITEE